MASVFKVDMLCFAGLGSFVLWLQLQYGSNLKTQIEGFVNDLAEGLNVKLLISLTLFAILGSILSVVIVSPGTVRQALAAGMACTALAGGFITPSKRSSAPSKGGKAHEPK